MQQRITDEFVFSKFSASYRYSFSVWHGDFVNLATANDSDVIDSWRSKDEHGVKKSRAYRYGDIFVGNDQKWM